MTVPVYAKFQKRTILIGHADLIGNSSQELKTVVPE